jgi:periplasmic protein TonB
MNHGATASSNPMRKVYTPPPHPSHWPVRLAGTALITFCVFMVLPLTTLVSSYAKRELLVTRVDTTALEAPPPAEEPPPPPPPPEPMPEEPPPVLADTAPPIAFSLDLDVAVGSGGLLPGSWIGAGAGAMAREIAEALDVADLDKPPTLISSTPPTYPAELRRARVEGTVTLVFVLTEEGRVEDPRVESSSQLEFEKPALDAVRRWRFNPGMKDGVAVRTFLRLPIRFRAAG